MGSTLDIAALYSENRDAVLRYFVRRTGDGEVALDLMAETFAQAVAGSQRFRGHTPAEATGWLYGIARRLLADYHRRGRTGSRVLARLALERPERNPEIVLEVMQASGMRDLQDSLNTAVGGLSPALRKAIRLRIIEGHPYAAVAQQLRITEPAARARVSRGLTALADAVDREAIQEMRTT